MRKGEITRNAILDRAVRLASQVGLSGLTIGRLAEELGLSKSGLFAHFQSKEALEVQVLGRASHLFVQIVVRRLSRLPAASRGSARSSTAGSSGRGKRSFRAVACSSPRPRSSTTGPAPRATDWWSSRESGWI